MSRRLRVCTPPLARRLLSAKPATAVTPIAVQRYLAELEQFDLAANVTCHELSGSHALISLPVPANMIRPGGYISGPMQFSVADLAMWVLSWGVAGQIEDMALTSDLAISFLKPGIGGTIFSRVDLTAHSGRKVISTAVIWASDEPDGSGGTTSATNPCSVATSTYVLPRESV